jgi:competence ComEA-like helix-hairpin-helix protein
MGTVNRFFEFSRPQLRVIISLVILFMVLSFFYFVKNYSDTEEDDLRLSVQLGDGDARYFPSIQVDLNLSPADSLELLPYIGPTLASRIVAYRDSVRFEKPEDILKVNGIGRKTYEKIRAYLKVESW